ncbi:MAG: hypothetical protein HEQ35_14675 [Gloeotrichia echinulata IR180]|jgi:hypothetical protein
MMKSSAVALVIVISPLAMTESVYANQENVPSTIGERNQAEVLVTEPATLSDKWNYVADQTDNSTQNPNSIVILREQGCPKFNPLDLIKNPSGIFKPCPLSTNIRTSQSTEPIEYLKVPRLDSGLSITVTKF